jgi:hypothetical protein
MPSNLGWFFNWFVLRVFLFTAVMGVTGIFLIGLGVAGAIFDWAVIKQVEWYANLFGSLITLVGTAATATAVYFYKVKSTPPSPESWWTAPMVIIGCVIAFLYLIFSRDHELPSHIVNGFALLGLSGALLRLQPNWMLLHRGEISN